MLWLCHLKRSKPVVCFPVNTLCHRYMTGFVMQRLFSDPYSKQVLGVIDLSTTWKNHNSLGLLAAETLCFFNSNALLEQQKQQLYIRAFRVPQVLFNGKVVVMTPRQIEILVILALCPQGMSLDTLHQALYGERKVSMGTLKAEMSQLRDILGGMLGSRPYRVLAHIEADFLQAEQALDAGYVQSALQTCAGVFLAKTESPFLCAWRDCLESRLSDAIFNAQDTDVLLKHLARSPEAIDAVERLIELMPKGSSCTSNFIKIHSLRDASSHLAVNSLPLVLVFSFIAPCGLTSQTRTDTLPHGLLAQKAPNHARHLQFGKAEYHHACDAHIFAYLQHLKLRQCVAQSHSIGVDNYFDSHA